MSKYELPVYYNRLNIKEKSIVRQQYITEQNNNCYFCGESLDLPPPPRITMKHINWKAFPGGKEGFMKYPVHLQHNHVTGLTEGAVHSFCNAVLWQYHGR